MDSSQQERLLALATTAPNVDNAHPFYFRWQEDKLLIFRDATRHRRRGNAGNYISLVGLGCLVECIVIAATGEGHAAVVDLAYDPDRLEAPWVVVAFRPNSAAADVLLPGLRLRCSDRRPYQGGDLAHPVFAQVLADADRFPTCHLAFRAPTNPSLLDYMVRCEAFLWADKQILPEMLSWVRWSQKEVQRTHDGVPWQALGVTFLTSRLMRLVAASTRFCNLARRSGAPLRAQQKTMARNIRSAAALACLSVADTRAQTMLALGRLFLRAWVRLNMAGFGVQVMANPAIHAFQHVAGILPDDYPAASKRTFAQGPSRLAEAFALPADHIPAWMFRTGKSTPLPASMRTLRLPLSELVHNGDTA